MERNTEAGFGHGLRKPGRILILTPDLRTVGGVENYYAALDLPGHDERIDYFFVTGIRRETIFQLLARLVRNYLLFWRRLGTGDYDLVVLNPSLNPHSYYRDTIFCGLALIRGCKVLAFFRGWSEKMESQILRNPSIRLLFRGTFRRVRKFIVLGDVFRAKLLLMGCHPASTFWTESTLADDTRLHEFSLDRKLRQDGPLRILFMSRLVAAKGADLAIRAFHLAQQRLPDRQMELVIAGEGPYREKLERLVQENDIPRVHFPGVLRDEAKHRLLCESHILLFPTAHGEGMPNVILEAMLYGIPVISRAVGGIPDAVQDQQNGLLIEALDPEAFAAALTSLATDTTLYRRIATENHLKAKSMYTSTAVRERLTRIFDQVLSSSAA